MSNQGRDVLVEPADPVGCCSPLVREPLSGGQAVELARVFKAMADPVRLRLLSLIASHAGGEACVCDLTEVFDLTGPTISHHLKVLREAGPDRRRATRDVGLLPGPARRAAPGLSDLLDAPTRPAA